MELERTFAGRVDTKSDGTEQTFKLTPRQGGKKFKVLHVAIKTTNTSSNNIRYTIELWHGPDGHVYALHSTIFSSADPGSTFPALLASDADVTKVINEYTMLVIKVKDTALTTAMWAQVEVWE